MHNKESMDRIQANDIQEWGKAGKVKGEYLMLETTMGEIIKIVK